MHRLCHNGNNNLKFIQFNNFGKVIYKNKKTVVIFNMTNWFGDKEF